MSRGRVKLTLRELKEKQRLRPLEFAEYLCAIDGERAFARAYARHEDKTVDFFLKAGIPLQSIRRLVEEGDTRLLDNLLRHYSHGTVINYISDILDVMLENAFLDDASETVVWLFAHVPRPAFAGLVRHQSDFAETLATASAEMLSVVAMGLKRHELFAPSLFLHALINGLCKGAAPAVDAITTECGKDIAAVLFDSVSKEWPQFFGVCHAGCLSTLLGRLASCLRGAAPAVGAQPQEQSIAALLDGAGWLGRAACAGADALCDVLLAHGACPRAALRHLVDHQRRPWHAFTCLTQPGDLAFRRCLDAILRATPGVEVTLSGLIDAPGARRAAYAACEPLLRPGHNCDGLSCHRHPLGILASLCAQRSLPLPIAELLMCIAPPCLAWLRCLATGFTPSLNAPPGVTLESLSRDDPAAAAALSLSWMRDSAAELVRTPAAAGEAFADAPLMCLEALDSVCALAADGADGSATSAPCPGVPIGCAPPRRGFCLWEDIARAHLLVRFFLPESAYASALPRSALSTAAGTAMTSSCGGPGPNVVWALQQIEVKLGQVPDPYRKQWTPVLPKSGSELAEDVCAATLWVVVAYPPAASARPRGGDGALWLRQRQEPLRSVHLEMLLICLARASEACMLAPMQCALALIAACVAARGAPSMVDYVASALSVFSRHDIARAAAAPARLLECAAVAISALTVATRAAYGPEYCVALDHAELGYSLMRLLGSPFRLPLAALLFEAGANPFTVSAVLPRLLASGTEPQRAVWGESPAPPQPPALGSSSDLRRLLVAVQAGEARCAQQGNAVWKFRRDVYGRDYFPRHDTFKKAFGH